MGWGPFCTAGTVALPPDQGHHAQSVLRLNTGDRIVLFDGAGTLAEAILDRLAKSTVTARLDGPLREVAPPAIHLTLATAVPKGERAEWLVEQASQLNVAAIQWLDCDRSVVKPREGGGKIEKWRRLAIESAKQCHRAHLLQIHEMGNLAAVLAGAATFLWLDPGGDGVAAVAALHGVMCGRIVAFIGPEGGWSIAERKMLGAAVREGTIKRVRLTDTVLRIETASAALAAVVMSR